MMKRNCGIISLWTSSPSFSLRRCLDTIPYGFDNVVATLKHLPIRELSSINRNGFDYCGAKRKLLWTVQFIKTSTIFVLADDVFGSSSATAFWSIFRLHSRRRQQPKFPCKLRFPHFRATIYKLCVWARHRLHAHDCYCSTIRSLLKAIILLSVVTFRKWTRAAHQSNLIDPRQLSVAQLITKSSTTLICSARARLPHRKAKHMEMDTKSTYRVAIDCRLVSVNRRFGKSSTVKHCGRFPPFSSSLLN